MCSRLSPQYLAVLFPPEQVCPLFFSPDSVYLQLESLTSSAAKLSFHADLRWAHAPLQELQQFLCRTHVCGLQPSDQGPCSPVCIEATRSRVHLGYHPFLLMDGWLHVCIQLLRRDQPFPLPFRRFIECYHTPAKPCP